MIPSVRSFATALAIAAVAAMLCAAGASADTVGAVQTFPTPCDLGALSAGPDGNVWFPCSFPGDPKSVDRATIGRMAPDGTFTDFSEGIPPGASIGKLTTGADGNLWFPLSLGPTKAREGAIGRITPAGTVTIFRGGLRKGAEVDGMVAGSDGSLWFTDFREPEEIGRVTTDGAITEFPIGLPDVLAVGGLAAGAEGSIWFSQEFDLPHGDPDPGGLIGKVTPEGTVTSYGSPPSALGAPISGPDGNVWFVEAARDISIDRVTPAGEITRMTDKVIGAPSHLATGPDGNVWFTAQQSIGRVTPGGELTSFYTCLYYRQRFSEATTIVPGPADDLWFLSVTSRQTPGIGEPSTIGRITTDGKVTLFKDGIAGTPDSIVAGPGGAVWFTDGEGLQRIVPPTAPVNTFILGKTEAKRGGSTEVYVEVPGAGRIEVRPLEARLPGGVVKKMGGGTTERVAPICGQRALHLKLRGAVLAAFRAGRQVKLRLSVTFTPTGGSPNTEVRTALVRPAR